MLFHLDENEHIRFVARRQSNCTNKIFLYIKVQGHLCHLPYILNDIEQFLSFLIPNKRFFVHLIYHTTLYSTLTFYNQHTIQDFLRSFRKRPYVITQFDNER